MNSLSYHSSLTPCNLLRLLCACTPHPTKQKESNYKTTSPIQRKMCKPISWPASKCCKTLRSLKRRMKTCLITTPKCQRQSTARISELTCRNKRLKYSSHQMMNLLTQMCAANSNFLLALSWKPCCLTHVKPNTSRISRLC